MKKYISLGLSLILVLGIVACGQKPQEQQEPQEPKQEEIQQTEPASTEPTTPPEEQEPKPQPVSMEPATPALDEVKDDTGVSGEAGEVEGAGNEESTAPVVELFTDCNETVYATGTVNLRSGPGTDYDKTGSLNGGQSVTRIGIGIVGGEADGWSKIQLADGVEVYVSSKYLSTTKPVVQVSNNSNGNNSKPADEPQLTEEQQEKIRQRQEQEEARRKAVEAAGGYIDEWGNTVWPSGHGTSASDFKFD